MVETFRTLAHEATNSLKDASDRDQLRNLKTKLELNKALKVLNNLDQMSSLEAVDSISDSNSSIYDMTDVLQRIVERLDISAENRVGGQFIATDRILLQEWHDQSQNFLPRDRKSLVDTKLEYKPTVLDELIRENEEKQQNLQDIHKIIANIQHYASLQPIPAVNILQERSKLDKFTHTKNLSSVDAQQTFGEFSELIDDWNRELRNLAGSFLFKLEFEPDINPWPRRLFEWLLRHWKVVMLFTIILVIVIVGWVVFFTVIVPAFTNSPFWHQIINFIKPLLDRFLHPLREACKNFRLGRWCQ